MKLFFGSHTHLVYFSGFCTMK